MAVFFLTISSVELRSVRSTPWTFSALTARLSSGDSITKQVRRLKMPNIFLKNSAASITPSAPAFC